ncbi:helix-turn-helix domain-containing protein [Xanthobacter aminoxidans]|uniref:helix-turn-helix transcriptional regulator n=1 Tax=Xanthobacter aminoxidans TaxID=186280 RepID=UPI00372C6240
MTTTLPLVRAAAIAPLMVWLRDSGYSLDQMLLDAGLPAGLIEDRDRPIPLMAGIRLLMEVVGREGHDVPCRLVAHAGIEELGFLGQIVMTSRTPREAFTKVARAYLHHGSHELFTLTPDPGGGAVRHAFRVPVDAEHLSFVHQYVAALIRTVALRTGHEGPLIERMELTPHPRHGVEGMSAQFGCEVVPAANRTVTMVFSDAVLDRPYVNGRQVADVAVPAGSAVIRGDGTLAGSITTILPALMEAGTEPSLACIAELAFMSRRTLQRRLAAEGASLSELIDKVRAEQAIARLTATGSAIRTVAAEVGYGSNASFSRAIRRWTSTSPSRLRRSALHRQAGAEEEAE